MAVVSDPLAITEDAFLGGALRIRQPAHGYRAGLDAILLAAACPAERGRAERCLDCGAGVGVVGLAVARRVDDIDVALIERDPVLASLARENVVANKLGGRVRVIERDLTAPLMQMPELASETNTYDHVLANPPYHTHGAATRAPDALKDVSHAMLAGEFEHWARFAAAMTRDRGTFTVIHRADALDEILAGLRRRFGAIRIVPLHPRDGVAASRVLVQATKASRAALEILPGRMLHAPGEHVFAAEFDAILRNGAPFSLQPV